jgi:hypothetical protein
VLSLRKIPRRFIAEKDKDDYTTLTFGSGVINTEDADYIPNPSDFVLPATIRGVEDGFTISSIDPENFLNTGTLGAAPDNVTLTIKYRIGGGLDDNVATNAITKFYDKKVQFTNTSISGTQRNQTNDSITISNYLPATGGADNETNDELKAYASLYFGTQSRVITVQDYVARTLSMNQKFGTVFRAYAIRDPNSDFIVQLAVVGRDSDGKLIDCNDQLKLNVINYLSLLRPLNDRINIIDAKIINIELYFEIVANERIRNKEYILANCLLKLKDYFNIERWQMGEHLSLSDVSYQLQQVDDVLAVNNIRLKNLYGTVNGNGYSNDTYSILGHTRNNILYVDSDSILEIRYPNIDIKGSVLTI